MTSATRTLALASRCRALARSGPLANRPRPYSTATSPDARPLQLYTAGTPNGHKVSILLEELRAAYGITYDVHPIDIRTGEQKQPWFLALNPNGRIPALVDPNRAPRPGAARLPDEETEAQRGFAVFESAAILLYLARHYDTQRKFAFDAARAPEDWSEMLQWIFFAHGGIGPMQGQANHFVRFAPEDIPYGKKRYQDETKRLYGVLQMRLQDRDWLAGPQRGTYSLADLNAVPWVAGHAFAGIEALDEWPRVKAWVERTLARPAVQAGMRVP